jgi:Nucleotidyltransferase domain
MPFRKGSDVADWHAGAMEAFVNRWRRDPDARGVVLVGSVARGDDRPDSDVDLYLVVTDAAFDRAAAAGRIAFVDRSGIDDPHGYVDVKLVSPAYLQSAVEAGDDPLRASFVGARVLWAAGDGLAEAIGALLEPGDAYFASLESAFLAQVALHGGYFLPQALTLDSPLLAHHAAVHAAFAAGRLVLAHDRVFFRGAKYLDAQLAASPSAPPGLTEGLAELVAHPSTDSMREVEAALSPLVPMGFGISDEVLSRFISDNELSWRTGVPPAEFR